VTLLAPNAARKNPSWRARWVDPDTGKLTTRALAEAESRTAELRRDYAVALAKRNGRRLDELAAGASPHRSANVTIEAAFNQYFESWGKRKRGRTQADYRRACDLFLKWCALPAIDLRTVRQLSKGHLRAYAGHRATAQLSAKCGRAGARAASTINKELRWLGAVLGELRAMEVIRLTRDDLLDGLKRLDEPINKREFVRSGELRAILDCCRRHDAEPYAGDHSGKMLATVLFILLTGLRIGEAAAIEWSDVVDGQIRVRAAVSKTNRERVIDMAHSPLLAALVSDPRGRTGAVLGGTDASLYNARERLIKDYGAPDFDYQELRCTCGTFLTCAPGVFAAASAYMSARQLGHSVAIAEKHYVGVVKVPADARTTEAAMQLEISPEACPRL
jgi:integrase